MHLRIPRTPGRFRSVLALVVSTGVAPAFAEELARDLFVRRGFKADRIELPSVGERFPVERLRNVRFKTLVKLSEFPEGPSYRPFDDSYFFSGTVGLTRLDSRGRLHPVVERPSAGGTHTLPDRSLLLIGHTGLYRVYPDGRIELLADGQQTGPGNDLTVGRFQEIYFSVPKRGIYRLTSGPRGRLERVIEKGANGLDVDPRGKFLYVARGSVERYPIRGSVEALGPLETVYRFPKGGGGGDGCAFDVWGNFYTMNFRTGTIRVIDPERGELLAEIPVGVEPASNLTFGGPRNTDLLITAGAPRNDNCSLLRAQLRITGFCGHTGGTDYPAIRLLDQQANREAFAAAAEGSTR